MENKICLDTDVVADFLRNKEYATRWFKENHDKELAITFVNLFELCYGAYKATNSKQSLNAVRALADNFIILNFSLKSVEEAAKQLVELENKGQILEIKDIFIAAIAKTEGFSLKTNNKKHFERIKGLNVIE